MKAGRDTVNSFNTTYGEAEYLKASDDEYLNRSFSLTYHQYAYDEKPHVETFVLKTEAEKMVYSQTIELEPIFLIANKPTHKD